MPAKDEDDDGRRILSADLGEVSAAPPPVPPDTLAFLIPKEHRRFTEFATALRTNRHIGVCYAPPGVGKTLSTRTYAGVTEWEQWQRTGETNTDPIPARVLEARTAFWPPTVTISPREIERQLPRACQRISWAIEYAREGDINVFEHRDSRASGLTGLLIIDEADLLKPPALEQVWLRPSHDGVILIGMPGIEKRLARFPQLYSRIGFAHHYRTLSTEELTLVLTNRWQERGLSIDPNDFTDAEAIAAVARITNGNFRPIQRLIAQIMRIRDINQLNSITKEVVEAARETLLIGA